MKGEGKFIRFLNGKGFYAALGVCMIAIGVSAWTAMSSLSSPPETGDNSSGQESLVAEAPSDITVDKNQSGIPDEKAGQSSLGEPAFSSQEVTSTEPEQSVQAPVAKYFIYPVNGEIMKDYSDSELQYSLTYNDMRLHTGIDIKADAGSSVKSSGDGVVVSVEKDPLWGYTVTVDHGNGITGIYAGLTEAVAVKKGDAVKAGTNLGPLGTVTGECLDAPHLHLEFRENEVSVSPKSLLTDQ